MIKRKKSFQPTSQQHCVYGTQVVVYPWQLFEQKCFLLASYLSTGPGGLGFSSRYRGLFDATAMFLDWNRTACSPPWDARRRLLEPVVCFLAFRCQIFDWRQKFCDHLRALNCVLVIFTKSCWTHSCEKYWGAGSWPVHQGPHTSSARSTLFAINQSLVMSPISCTANCNSN